MFQKENFAPDKNLQKPAHGRIVRHVNDKYQATQEPFTTTALKKDQRIMGQRLP